MATLEAALLLEIPETIETPSLQLAMTPEDSERHCREMQAKGYARQELDFCFHRKPDGRFVGKGGLHTIDWSIPKFEIGYWIRTTSARRIEITSDARNIPSRRVAEKCGFTLEGIRRASRRDNAGELADSCMYARIS